MEREEDKLALIASIVYAYFSGASTQPGTGPGSTGMLLSLQQGKVSHSSKQANFT